MRALREDVDFGADSSDICAMRFTFVVCYLKPARRLA
jgi:hypothetical protein